MKKSELVELLNDINGQYWNKLTDIIHKESFLNTWYEALKDYDYDLIKYVYSLYNDTQFPPTAKYFTVYSDQLLDTIKEEIRLATNELWVWSLDGWKDLNNALTTYIDKVPWKSKNEVLNRLKREFLISTREEKKSFKEWINER